MFELSLNEHLKVMKVAQKFSEFFIFVFVVPFVIEPKMKLGTEASCIKFRYEKNE